MTYKGTQRLGEFFSSRREKGIVGISTLSVTIDNGVVERNSIDRRMETNLSADEHLLGKSGDIAYNMMRMWQGASGFIEKDGLLSPSYIVLAPKQGINSKYAAYLFKSPRLIYLFWAYSYGLTNDRLRLYFNDFIRIPVEIPPKPEQTKIANFLTAIDEKISQLTQKYDLLAQYKKGVMQQVFSQKLRFKDEDGREFPEWEEKNFHEVVDIQGGYAFKSQNFNAGLTKVIRIGDIALNIRLSEFKGVYSSEKPSNKFLVKKNDSVIALSGATFGKVGKIIDDGEAFINQRVATFRTKKNLDYIYQILLSEEFKGYIASIPTSSAQPNISNDDIGKYQLKFPCPEEQTKIANFLTAIDDKITQTQAQLEAAKLYKKGLLQQMFV